MEKDFKLPKEFAEKWIAALRSGKYSQTRGQLFNEHDNGFCCLGVACITVGYTTDDLKSKEGGDGYASIITFDDGETPDAYTLAKDLPNVPKEIKGRADRNELVSELTEMNDNSEGSKSFEEIATWIEENVEFY